MASPHINGVVALMRQAAPDMSVEEIKEIIFQTAYDLGDSGEDNDYGWGMVDAFEAVLHTSLPPEIPVIDGPTDGIVIDTYEFKFSSEDPEDDDIYYLIDWDDNTSSEWIGPYNSGEEIIVNHTWYDPGTYEIRAKAKDNNYAESDWSEPHIMLISENQPPDKVTIDGPKWGFGGKEYEFTFTSADPEEHNIYYMVDWDDDLKTDWLGPFNSSETITLNHSWKIKGEYCIKAWAKDLYDGTSKQSSFYLKILTNAKRERPRNPLFTEILERFLRLFPIFQKLLGLE
jgi:hypothetical protein